MAARRPPADRPLPESSRRQGEDHTRRRGRSVRRARGRPHADPRVHARPLRGATRQDVVRARGVLLRPRASPSVQDLDAPRGHPRRPAGQRAGPHVGRRRRLCVVLIGGHRQRLDVRGRSVRGPERADRRDVRLHEQSSVRRHARVRGRPGLLRARVPDRPAGQGAADRSRRASAQERAEDRLGPPDRPGHPGQRPGPRGDRTVRRRPAPPRRVA